MFVTLPTDPFGTFEDLKELRKTALTFCQVNYRDMVIQNESTRELITITIKGVKHTLYQSNPNLIRSLAVLPEILRYAEKTAVVADKISRPEVVRVHKYQTTLIKEGDILVALIVVKETPSGVLNYYDHGFMKK